MDTAQWPQEIVVKPMEEIVVTNTTKPSSSLLEMRQVRPQAKEQTAASLNCPRCNSTNTKFCYYNNYSLSQPRYFCKTCRRYWTEGGSLRSIPVGGGSRKNKRSSSSSSSSSASSKKLPADLVVVPQPPPTSSQSPKIIHVDDQDLNLGFPSTSDFKTISQLIQVPNFDGNNKKINQIPISSTSSSNSPHLSALELLTGITSRGFMPMPPNITDIPNSSNTVYSSGFPSLTEFKPSLCFSLDGGIGSSSTSGYGSLQGVQETSGRLLFPFEDLKQQQLSNKTTPHDSSEHNREYPNGYWNGMLGGGSW